MGEVQEALRIRVTRTFTDYLAVIMGSFGNGGGWKLIAFGGVVASGFVFFPGVAQQNPTVLGDSARTGVLAVLLASALALALLLVKVWSVSRRPGALAPTLYTFSYEGVHVMSPAGTVSTRWDVWSRAVETRAHFVLLSKGGAAHVLPKRDLDVDERMRLRSLLNDALGGPSGVFVEHRT